MIEKQYGSICVKIFSKSKNKLSDFFGDLKSVKTEAEKLNSLNCVYKISCKNCENCYIGETGRPLFVRINEHQKSNINLSSSTVNRHANEFSHEIAYDNVEILSFESNSIKRKLLESYYLRNYRTFNGNKSSLELLF